MVGETDLLVDTFEAWHLVVRTVAKPVELRYNGATQYARAGMVVRTVQGKPWHEIAEDGAAAASWVQQCKERPLMLGFAVADDGGPLVMPRSEAASPSKKAVAGGLAIIAQAHSPGR